MHAEMTAVTMQCNKIFSNEVKDCYGLLQPSFRKKQMNALANPIENTLAGLCPLEP